jgi:dihydropyrimidinase
MGIVLRGGTVVTAADRYKADVRVEDEKITAVGNHVTQPEDRILNIEGCYLLPGGIDAHTHFDLPAGDMVTADDFSSGTKAAIMGGTTTIIDYATQFKGESLSVALQNWHMRAQGKCYADYAFHMAITDWNDSISREMSWLADCAGVASVKLYMAYKNILQVDDSVLFQALTRSKECGILVCVHCENGDIVYNLVNQFCREGNFSPEYHALARPEIAESEAVNRLTALAKVTGASVYVVHLSCRDSLQVVSEAKEAGVPVYAETCPQYLLLDESRYQEEHFNSAKYVMSPPLRKKENQEYLWNGLKSGTLDTVATDHCSFNFYGQKDKGRHDFSRIPNGAPGVETRLGLLYTYGVKTGKISLNQFVKLISTQPAKLFGLFPRKGTIAPGSDADLVVWEDRYATTIRAAEHHQRVDYSAYEGMKQYGRALHVFLRGRQVVREGILCDAKPEGIYIPRAPFSCKRED